MTTAAVLFALLVGTRRTAGCVLHVATGYAARKLPCHWHCCGCQPVASLFFQDGGHLCGRLGPDTS